MSARWSVLLLLLGAGAACGAELGRLFFTPAQRETLDAARKQNIRIEIGSEDDQQPQQQPQQQAQPVPQHMSVNGLVQRSDGKSTVWVNQRAITEQQQTGGGVKVTPNRRDNRVKLTVPESGRSVDLKVGQSYEVVGGTIEEAYTRRPSLKPEAKVPAGPENTTPGVEKAPPAQPREAPK